MTAEQFYVNYEFTTSLDSSGLSEDQIIELMEAYVTHKNTKN